MTKLIKFGALAGVLLTGGIGCGGKKCDPACATGSVCNETTGVCESQSADGGSTCSPGCSGATPRCLDSVCVQCEDSSQCAGTLVCNPADHTCVDSLPQPDAGPQVTSCDPSLVVNLQDAGFQDGLYTYFIGDVRGRPNTTRPPTGCQTDPMADGLGTEVVHAFSMPVKGDLILTTDLGFPLDSVVYNLTTCGGGVAPASSRCNDDVDVEGQNYASTTVVPGLEAGASQFLVVDGFSRGASLVDGGTAYALGVGVRPWVGSGADCDSNYLLNKCGTGLACGLTSKCQTATAPVIAGGGFYELTSGVFQVSLEGSDVDADVVAVTVEVLNASGTALGQGTFALTPSVAGQASFKSVQRITINEPTLLAVMTSVRISLNDSSGLSSSPASFPRVALPTLTDGGTCFTTGFSGNCAESFFCDLAAMGGPTCAQGTAPTLGSAEAFSATGDYVPRALIQGTDPQGDISSVVVRYVQSDAGFVIAADGGIRADTLALSEYTGTTSITAAVALQPAVLAQATQLEVKLRDATGLVSSALTVPINPLPLIAAAATCDVRGWGNNCSTAAPICAVATAKCDTVSTVRMNACTDAQALSLGTPETPTTVTFSLPLSGSDLFPASCGQDSSGGPEKVFKFTTTGPSTDVFFSTDFPETAVNTVIYTTTSCTGQTPDQQFTGCSDDVSPNDLNFKTRGTARGLPAGTHYLFVDSWRTAKEAGAGQVKLSVSVIPALTASGAACDPLSLSNHCASPLRCLPSETYLAFTCR